MSNRPGIWNPSPVGLILEAKSVYVWLAKLDQSSDHVQQLLRSLSRDEYQRSQSYRFARDRRNYIVARGLLRELLAACIGLPPSEVVFKYGPHGKPEIANDWTNNAICFNLAHSHDVVIYAVTCHRRVGIDIEYVFQSIEIEELSNHILTERERATLQTLTAIERQLAFFTYWTRKEAYIKATGEGLSVSLNGLDVSFAKGNVPTIGITRGVGEVANWSIQDLRPLPGYMAALAVEGDGWELVSPGWYSGSAPNLAL